jgi:hypothetical protein
MKFRWSAMGTFTMPLAVDLGLDPVEDRHRPRLDLVGAEVPRVFGAAVARGVDPDRGPGAA